jgi:hypothetical protein
MSVDKMIVSAPPFDVQEDVLDVEPKTRFFSSKEQPLCGWSN